MKINEENCAIYLPILLNIAGNAIIEHTYF